MVDLEELREFATGLPCDADTLVRDAIAELAHLRAKAAAGAKLREAYTAIRDKYECDENDTDHTCEVADRLLNALDAWAAAVGEGGG